MKLVKFSLLLVIVHTHFDLNVLGSDCSVTIKNGIIIGAIADTANPFKKTCTYMGIPYASAPIGPLRFKPPQPAKAWDTINATAFPNWCPQEGSAALPPELTISEDCLFLNVFQPKMEDASNASLPVMIFFHGGAYTSGSSIGYSSNTKLLARADVILVVVHYRIGLLGFLSTGDSVAPGNYGLKDQAFSIRWVNENIKAFGGNPDRITIFGESAGAGSVIYQLISPLNRGLIHGVIAQSGTALMTYDENPSESAKFMAKRFDCPTSSSEEIVDCMRSLNWEEIIEKQAEYLREGSRNMTRAYATLTPVVEPDLPGAVVTRQPRDIMKDGDFDTTIPVILGANKHEGTYSLASMYLGRIGPLGLDKDPTYMRDELVPEILKFARIQGDSANRAVASTVEMTYLAGVNRSSWNDSVPGLVDILTVFAFKSSMLETAELLSKRGNPVYLYSFEHHSENTLWSLFFGTIDIPIEHGITHTDDLIYLFDLPANFSQDDETFSDIICDMWLDFGKFGNPTPSPSDRYDQWPTYDAVNESFMKLNVTPTAQTDYRSSWRPNGFQWS